MRNRDLGIIFVAALAGFLALQGGDHFKAERRFTVDIDASHYKNHHTPGPHEHVPLPIITDVDGDGNNEFIVVSREPKIYIYDTFNAAAGLGLKKKKSHEDLRKHLMLKAESTLLSKARVKSSRQPVAIATGYLTKGAKTQVIVVLTHDWTVLCYDHHLKLKWESHPVKKKWSDVYHKEATISITPTKVRTKDIGLVVVGASLELANYERFYEKGAKVTSKNHKNVKEHRKKKKESKRDKKIRKNLVKSILKHGDKKDTDGIVKAAQSHEAKTQQEEEEEIEEMRHFSYYAMDGHTGGLRWKQESGDWSLHTSDQKLPQHHYKLDFHSESKHAGEVDWRQYRASVLQSLPHHWDRREDTAFEIAHYSKRTRRDDKENAAREAAYHNREVGLFDSVPLPVSKRGDDTVALDKTIKEAEDKKLPNVLVAHLSEGIEVIHLYTGRTLCQIPLPAHALNADINHDGAIDRIESIVTMDGEAAEHQKGHKAQDVGDVSCYAFVTTGTPPTHALFNQSICDGGSGSHRGLVQALHKQVRNVGGVGLPGMMGLGFGGMTDNSDGDEDNFELHTTMPGLVLRDHRRDSVGRLFEMHDSVFLVSDGTATSFSPNGHVNWQKSTDAYWVQPAMVREVEVSDKTASEGERHLIEVDPAPQVRGFRPRKGHREENTLVVGMYWANILGHDGESLVRIQLPDVPTEPVVVGDFDSDGYNDIVFVTRTGYHGFTVSHKKPNQLLAFLLGALLVVMALVASTQSLGGSSSSYSSVSAGRAGGMLSAAPMRRIKKERATD